MNNRTIDFYFDYISPYAYLGWTQIHTLAGQHGASVRPVPILFAALLDHHGQLGPAEIPAKRLHVMKDVARRAAFHGVPLAAPPSHPFNPLPALRATLAAPAAGRKAVIHALFRAIWAGDYANELDSSDAVAAVLDAAGLPFDREGLGDPAIKQALRENTTRAIANDVFGVPTMIVDGELFWGSDSLPLLQRHLAGADTTDRALFERLRDLPSSAQRQR
ncbi:MAG: 2-hydroxychromene-2-carboxylate isomerase [Pseudomonadota bacterium]